MARFAVSLFALATALIVALADTANLGFLYNVYAFPDGDKAGHFALYGTLTLLVRLAIHRLQAEGRSTIPEGDVHKRESAASYGSWYSGLSWLRSSSNSRFCRTISRSCFKKRSTARRKLPSTM